MFIIKNAKKKETSQVSDISEKALKISETHYRRLFETSHDGILIIYAATGRIAEVNPFLTNLLGYERRNFIGKSLWEFGLFKNIEKTKSTFHKLLNTGYIRYEHLAMETKDGKCIEVEFISNVYQIGSQKWIQCNIRDISKRKQTEATRLQLQLRLYEKRKIASIATLAGGIAHKFNNALTVITASLSLLEETELNQETLENYHFIQESAYQMSQITQELLTYAGKDDHHLETIFLNDLIKDNLSFFKSVVKSFIAIEVELPSYLPQIHADRHQILMILENILTNASEAIEKRGTIRITCCAEELIIEEKKASDGLARGTYVNLTITDTGKGMDTETCSRVFEPFFTTHFLGRGLGMAMVYGIVKNHGGRISIESQVNQGTAVCIYLPVVGLSKKALMPSPSAM
ncbi:MAG: PAS domain S-box protein [Desulfobacteraceae bacterium]|jgi:PAS domain S-box-containing protein